MKLLSTTVKHSLRNCHSSPVEQEKHKAPTLEIAKTRNFMEPLMTSHVSNLKEIADSQRGYDNPYSFHSHARFTNVCPQAVDKTIRDFIGLLSSFIWLGFTHEGWPLG